LFVVPSSTLHTARKTEREREREREREESEKMELWSREAILFIPILKSALLIYLPA
jgi:hypothetical protein